MTIAQKQPDSRQIILSYKPRDAFVGFHKRKQRWAVIIAHRRAGKTVACLMDMLDSALKLADGRFAYISPYFVQSKSVAWDYLKEFARPVLSGSPNESELRVDLLNGARINLYGGDNGDRLRGLALDGVILDEFADMPPSLWGSVVRPALADRKGWATIIGTVKGRNQLWETYEGARSVPEEWFSSILRASATGIIEEAELEDARRGMTPEAYAAEFECDPSAAILGAYYGKEIADAERQGRIDDVPVNSDLPVHTAWDLGIGDSTSIWFFQVSGSEIRIVDFYENHGQALAHYASVLKLRGYRYGDDWVPHDAKVRELGTGRTRVETLISLGRKPRLVPDHKVDDGINGARLTIGRCWFDAGRCREGLEMLRQYRADYDEKTRAFRNTPRHDFTSHACLVGGTLIKTARGNIPIEQVQIGDFVSTPAGMSKVTNAGPVKYAQNLIEINVRGNSLICTPEHKVFTQRGVVEADKLRYTDLVLSGDEWQCYLIGLFSRAIHIGFRELIIAVTTGDNQGRQIYTGQYGKMSTVLSQMVSKSIMLMETLSIMTSAILPLSKRASIALCTCTGVTQMDRSSHLQNMRWRAPQNGTPHLRGLHGIQKTESALGKSVHGINALARIAVKSFVRLILRVPNGAIQTAKPRRFESAGAGTLVYDLTVEKNACYRANGLLVSNSDAFRYLCMAWREIAPQPVPTKPKLLTSGPANEVTFADMLSSSMRRKLGM